MPHAANKIPLGPVSAMKSCLVWLPDPHWQRHLDTRILVNFLEEDEDWQDHVMQWLGWAGEGEMLHRHEGLALEICHRFGDDVLLRDYEGPSYVAVRLQRTVLQIASLEGMD